MALKYSDVGEIIRMIENSSCTEFNLETDDVKLQIRRGESRPTQKDDSGVIKSSKAATSFASGEEKDTHSESSSSSPAKFFDEAENGIFVRAPMVGTFYSKPSPDEASFVKVGSIVSKGETVCLIEVMKLFTAVESEFNGIIEKVFVVDGDLVEFDQPLFLISELQEK